MKKKEVICHFGNMARAMKAIGITRSVAVKWGEVVPAQHAVSFVIASNGELGGYTGGVAIKQQLLALEQVT